MFCFEGLLSCNPRFNLLVDHSFADCPWCCHGCQRQLSWRCGKLKIQQRKRRYGQLEASKKNRRELSAQKCVPRMVCWLRLLLYALWV